MHNTDTQPDTFAGILLVAVSWIMTVVTYIGEHPQWVSVIFSCVASLAAAIYYHNANKKLKK